MELNAFLMISSVLLIGILCQWVAWRMSIPAILPLLASGFVMGPMLNLLRPQEALGELFFPVISLSVAVILFEGALTLTWHEVKSVVATVRNLLVIGSLITWFGGAVAARYILALPWDLSLLFGALIIVTGPTVIAPLLRNVRPTAKIASILRWEGILIDPIGATIAVLVFDFIVAEAGAVLQATSIGLMRIIVVGTILGLVGGYVIHFLVKRYLIPDYLRDVATMVWVMVVFGISHTLAHESGLLAVTVMGIYLANSDLKQVRTIWFFKEKLSVLLISTLFILLAADITFDDLALLDWRAFLLLGVVILVLRPIVSQLSSLGSDLTCNERLFLSWIAPRGIVAAAVASLFTFELVHLGYEAARIIEPLVFLVIVGTVLIQGSTAKRLAQHLDVSDADPQGFLFMGGNRLATLLGTALQEEGFVVRLIDTNWHNVSRARQQGLVAYHSNILSEFVETHIDLSGVGRMLALTRNDEANALACKHMEEEFGSSEVYQLPPRMVQRERDAPSQFDMGRQLFGLAVHYDKLNELLSQGWSLKKTSLTDVFTLEDFHEQYGDDPIFLMAIREDQVVVSTVDFPLDPQPGWTLVCLIPDTDAIESEIPETINRKPLVLLA